MKKKKTNKIALFEGKEIRRDVLNGEWVYSVVDIVMILTNSIDPRTYWKVLKNRLLKEGNQTVTNCNQLKLIATDGKLRKTDVVNTQQALRLIQSIPSPNAEPFKEWLAQLGKERLDEIEQPEKAIQRGKNYYIAKGYDKKWIETRSLGIETRNELTDTLKEKGIEKPVEYSILTNEIYSSTFGMTTKQYKKYKSIDEKDSLRDNMSLLEIVSTAFTEASSSEMIKQSDKDGFKEAKKIINKAGSITKEAINKIEQETNQKVTSKSNFKHLDTPQKRKEIIQESFLPQTENRDKALEYNPKDPRKKK